jgi:hypothetical protein
MNTLNHFDRSRPFYPVVINYLTQLIGSKDLRLRGLIGTPEVEDMLQIMDRRYPLVSLEPKSEADKEALAQIREGIGTMAGPLQLQSEFQGNAITVDVDEIAQDVMLNSTYLIQTLMPAAGSIFITAFEMAKAKDWRNRDPLWEFLRHCRNAAAHGGRFTFQGKEPVRPAQWGHLEITRRMEGTPLFKDAVGNGFLSPGDPIRLLWDLEQAYPHIQA